MTVQPGSIYRFAKSGHLVKALEPTNYGGRGNWVVQRINGASAGKGMVVARTALKPVNAR
jgi:hypothetical protein